MSCVPVCDGWRVGWRGAGDSASAGEKGNPTPKTQVRLASSIRAFLAGSGVAGLAKSSGSGQAGAGAREGGLTRRLLRS